MDVREITPDLARQFQISPHETGVIVVEVIPESPAAQAQIHPGDVISELNRIEIRTLDDYRQALDISQRDQMLVMLIRRQGKLLYTIMNLSPPE